MGENGARHELLWNRMSVASRGVLHAVDKNVRVRFLMKW